MVFGLKNLFGKRGGEEYIEIDLNSAEPKDNKVIVKPYVLRQFEDLNDILNSLREGFTIAIIDISFLKRKDIVELKRAVAKIKKTVDAIEGSIAGFGENTIIVTPKFAEIYKTSPSKPKEKIDFTA